MKIKKDVNINKATETKTWVKPSVQKLGNAKDIVANVDVVGGGDSQFSVLLPS